MPLQNRVDPFGHLFTSPARGMWMGNRGCLHDDQRRVVREWKTKCWIICALSFKGIRRELMAPGRYTELFFLDEATALAAGHRPCAECRHEDYRRFKSAFAASARASGDMIASAAAIDELLHRSRTQRPREQVDPRFLPDGAMVELGGMAWLKRGPNLLEWSAEGYKSARPIGLDLAELLTPAPTIGALRQGFNLGLHPSVGDFD